MHRRHDMTDAVWERRGRFCPEERTRKAGRPTTTGSLKNTHRRFCRWRDRGEWASRTKALE